MSLYNAIFGRNPLSGALLELLGLGVEDVGRFRDCYVEMEDDKPIICVYTRNGGGNRDDYQGVFDALAKHPNYLGDSDDDFDCTYATIRFSVPEASRDLVSALAGKSAPPGDRWASMLAALRGNDASNPDAARALKVGEELIPKIQAAMETGKSAVVLIDSETPPEPTDAV